MSKPNIYIIAEAGVNHNGCVSLAKELIDAAASTGADAVKFQTFKASKLVSAKAQKAAYQKKSTGGGTQQEMLSKLELTDQDFNDLCSYANSKNIEFLSSAFDEESLKLVISLGVSRLKLGSGELTNGRMLEACAKSKLPLILSTGMAEITEIKEALSLLAHCYCNTNPIHSTANWNKSFDSIDGQNALKQFVTLLHCTTEYPCPMDQVDLLAMNHIRKEFNLPVGYSDHTEGINVSLAAAALGATVIEKHFTTDRNLPGPDHKASIDPIDFKKLVDGVREIQLALGSENKFVHSIESKNSAVARRSLTALKDIKAGEVFTEDNLTSKRPGTGVSPMRFWDLLGKKSAKNYQLDDLIEPDEL